MKILFLSRWFPIPADNGSRIRIFNLLRGLSQRHSVTLLSFSDQPDIDFDAPQVREICEHVEVVRWREFDPGRWRARLGFLSFSPRSIVDTFSDEMAKKIQQELSHERYDLIIASQLQMAAYHQYFQNVPAIFEETELGLVYEDSRRSLRWMRLRRMFTWIKLRFYFSRLLKSFRAVTVVSERERELVNKFYPEVGHVRVIPNAMNIAEYKGLHVDVNPNAIIFTGSFRYHANYEAMIWFIGKVFPLILSQIPDAELIITGDHLDLPLPSNKNVRRTGYVDDVRGLVASSMVALAPLRSGGGTRLKILEAMVMGTPVVTTSKGVEGLDAQNEVHLLVTDHPNDFANCVINLMTDRGRRRELSENALRLVQEKYDWSKVIFQFFELAEQISGK